MNAATSAAIQRLPEVYLDKKAYRDPSLHAAESEMLTTSVLQLKHFATTHHGRAARLKIRRYLQKSHVR
jgi:hypothetical protein